MRRVVAVFLIAAISACSSGGAEAPVLDPSTAGGGSPGATGYDEALHAELVAMMEEDQAERTGEVEGRWHDVERADRLREIVEQHGWPTLDLVGEEGATAAWLIAQHADHDVVFQEEMLALIREALADGQADPTEVAYLDDRVAVNTGRPQTYGTQIRCRSGRPRPATPIADRVAVDERRAEVGLGPLAEYYVELEEACAAEVTG